MQTLLSLRQIQCNGFTAEGSLFLMVNEGPRIQSLWILNQAIDGIEAPFIGRSSHAGARRELPEGARLLVCGDGFDEHTVKVLWEGNYYFVYTRQLCQFAISR